MWVLKFSCWISTLPLNKKGIILHPNLVYMVFEFAPSEHLCQNICILIFCGNVLKQHYSSLHTISEMMVPNIYVFGPIMKHKINREFNATPIIIMYHCRIHLRTKQTNQDISHLDSLTCSLTCCHVLCFHWNECHRSLFPIVKINSCRPDTKYSTWCSLFVRWTARPIYIHEAL